MQFVRHPAPLEVPIVDTTEATLGDLLRARACAPMDLERGDVFNACIARVGPADHTLLITAHHAAIDEVSLARLHQELTGPPPQAPAIEYLDYARWERERPDLERHIAYWHDQLAGVSARATCLGPGELVAREHLGDALLPLCKAEGVTPFMAHALIAALTIARSTNSLEVVMGTPMSLRTRPELEDVVGLLLNTVVLRVDLSRVSTAREALRLVRSVVLGALDHREAPLQRAVFDSLYVHHPTRPAPLVLDGVPGAPIDVHTGTAKLPLTIYSDPRSVTVEHALSAHDAADAREMVGTFAELVEIIARDPDVALGRWLRAPTSASTTVAPETANSPRPLMALETRLAALWSELLGARPTTSEADFFELGGHSLLAARLVTRVRAQIDETFSMRDVFGHPTLGAQASRLSSRPAPPAREPEDRPRDRVPATVGQRAIAHIERQAGAPGLHRIAARIDIRGPADAARIAASVSAVVARHEALRVVMRGDHFVAHEPTTLPVLDLPRGDRARWCTAILAAELEAPMALDVGPLLRARVLRFGPESHTVVLVLHHAIADLVSLSVLTADLAEAYAGTLAAEPPPQMSDHARAEADWLARTATPPLLEAMARRWVPPASRSSLACRAAAPSFVYSSYLTAVDARDAARAHGVTTFVALAAAWTAVLAQDDVLDVRLGVIAANRERPGGEGTVGLLANTCVMRAELDADPTLAELVSRVRDALLLALDDQHVPLEAVPLAEPPFEILLVHELQPDPPAGRSPEMDLVLYGADAAEGLHAEPVSYPSRAELIITFRESRARIEMALMYDTHRFEPLEVEQLTRRYARMLDALAHAPRARVRCVDAPKTSC